MLIYRDLDSQYSCLNFSDILSSDFGHQRAHVWMTEFLIEKLKHFNETLISKVTSPHSNMFVCMVAVLYVTMQISMHMSTRTFCCLLRFPIFIPRSLEYLSKDRRLSGMQKVVGRIERAFPCSPDRLLLYTFWKIYEDKVHLCNFSRVSKCETGLTWEVCMPIVLIHVHVRWWSWRS